MEKVLKWAIVGCGVISKSHGDALSVAKNAKLYAVCDIIEERAIACAKEFGAEKVYTKYEDLLADPDVDVVSICTPSGMHGEMCIQAAKAGKHILCEKPMEITKEKLDRVIEEVEKYPVKMGCVFQRRADPKFAVVKEAIDSGRFGKVILADAYLKYYRNQKYYDSGEWRATWELDGGGALMNQGVHGIDLLQWMAGEVESVFARCETQVRDIVVEDTAIASLKFKNGAIGNIEGTTSVYPAQDTRIEIHCEKGSIIVSDKGILQWAIEGSDEKAPVIEAPNFNIKADPTRLPRTSHVIPLHDMADAIIEDRDPLVTPRNARSAVDLILAIYKSSEEKREIIL
ncbi:MAG: Gfo/Idh/MocA family oxidoreductase [Clostridia bacterium]|nr:Gfo/Idh/MocA family oxidoreductase [Clostridia bacterium]